MANDINDIYQTYLGRAPDQAGIDYWMGDGVLTDDEVRQIRGSTEGIAKAPELGFSGYDPNAAAGTAAPINTVTNPYLSNQAMDVNAAYQTYLGRAPDASGLAYWGNTIDPHEWQQFLGSQGVQKEWQDVRNQYNQQHNITGVDAGNIGDWSLSNPLSAQDAYLHYLGRTPEQAGLDYWGQNTANIDPEEYLTFMREAGKEMGGLRAMLNPNKPNQPATPIQPDRPDHPDQPFSPTPWSPEPPVHSTIKPFNVGLDDPMSGKNWRGTVVDSLTQSLGGGSQEQLYHKVYDMLSQGKSVSEITRDLNLGMGDVSAVMAELDKLAQQKGWARLPLPGAVPMDDAGYYHYGFGPGKVQYTRDGKVNPLAQYFAQATPKAKGGRIKGGLSAIQSDPIIQRYIRGGRPTGGQEDDIPAVLSNNEYVMDADTVSALGDGNPDAGALKLDKMRENIRRHKRSASPKNIPPKAKAPEQYLKGK